jgi:Ca2+-binding EF-hand superfamily protein
MLRVNPYKMANLGMSLLNQDSSSTQTTDTYAKIGANKVFKDSDANGDKVITKDEVNLSQAAFDKLDADKNGKVSKEEMQTTFAGHGTEVYQYYLQKKKKAKSSELLTQITSGTSSSGTSTNTSAADKAAAKYVTNKDANKDGTLSRSELGLSATVFAKLDTTKDGKIDTTEMKAALKGYETTLNSYFSSSSTSSSTTQSSVVSSLLDVI